MRISKKFKEEDREFILGEIKKNIFVDTDILESKDGFQVQFLAPLGRNEELFLTSLENENEINKPLFKEFNPELASFKRNRYSTTQGTYSINYDGIMITSSKGEPNWYDDIQLKEDGNYVGYSDEHILKHIENVYNNGDIYNLIYPLKYNYKIN